MPFQYVGPPDASDRRKHGSTQALIIYSIELAGKVVSGNILCRNKRTASV
jgi:hypothetical protein